MVRRGMVCWRPLRSGVPDGGGVRACRQHAPLLPEQGLPQDLGELLLQLLRHLAAVDLHLVVLAHRELAGFLVEEVLEQTEAQVPQTTTP